MTRNQPTMANGQNPPVRTFALVGQPNVGKSVIMNNLTGAGVFVSNYPGTTVEVTEGVMSCAGRKCRVIDTPGTYTLHSDSEEQKVTQRILMEGNIDVVVNVADATNLGRSLYLTLQLLDFGIPLILVVNQIDRAQEMGLSIDAAKLEAQFGIPVVLLAATRQLGMEQLKEAMLQGGRPGTPRKFSPEVEAIIDRLVREISALDPGSRAARGLRPHSPRTLAVHLLEHDRLDEVVLRAHPGLAQLVERLQATMGTDNPLCPDCFRGCAVCPAAGEGHPVFLTCLERTEEARRLAVEATRRARPKAGRAQRVQEIVDNPVWGLPLLVATAYVSFRFIGAVMTWADWLVSALAGPLESWLTSWLSFLPAGPVRHILTAGLLEGVTLPFRVVMPAMLAIYAVMGFLEDTGLLARFAVAMHRATSFLGLPGQAVIPLLMGFGCRAPAVLATRALPERRQRFIALTLLGITVPCAASAGIIAAVAARFAASVLVIGATTAVVFLVLGLALGRWLPGETGDLLIEMPPLRTPVFRNVAGKTWQRVQSFFRHVLPLLLVAGVGIRVLLETDIPDRLSGLSSATQMLFGIGGEAFAGIVATCLQRYLAPLVLLSLPLAAREATIAATMVALSFPCLPVSVLILREMGWRSLLAICAMAIAIPLTVGFALNLLLPP